MYHINQYKYKNEIYVIILDARVGESIIKYIEAIDSTHSTLISTAPIYLPKQLGETMVAPIQTYNVAPGDTQLSMSMGRQTQASNEVLVSWPVYELHNLNPTILMLWNEAKDQVVLLLNDGGVISSSTNTKIASVGLLDYVPSQNDISDVLALVKHIIDIELLGLKGLISADLNQDGFIDISDVLLLIKQIIGLDPAIEQRIVAANGDLLSTMTDSSPQYHIITMGDANQSSLLSASSEPTSSITHGAFAFDVAENSKFVATTNLQDTAISLSPQYQLTGVDASLFELDGSSIKFLNAPDFEQAGDADTDNRYQITLEAGYDNYIISQAIVVTVINADESQPASPHSHSAPVLLLDATTGNTAIDQLLMGSMWGQQVGQGMDISYSFYDQSSTFTYTTSALTTAFGDGIKAVIQDCFDTLSSLTLLNFSLLEETQNQVGDIRLGYQAGPSYGAAFGPAQWSADSYGGDIYFKTEAFESWESATSGDFYYATVYHEIGHAIGLEHPHSEGHYADSLVFGSNSDVGSGARDAQPYTLMSYAAYQGGGLGYADDQRAQTFMVDDIAALQYLYGSNLTTNTGSNIYGSQTLTLDKPFETTVWDAGGIDLIDWRHGTLASIIDLSPGNLSFFSDRITSASDVDVAQMVAGEGILGIAYGTELENAYGGQGADVLLGNSVSNVLYGGPDSGVADSLTGGAAADYFMCTVADGASQSASVDRVKDYVVGEDKIALNAGLNYEDLQITYEVGNENNALIEYKLNNSMLLVLENVDYTLINIDDFVTYDFV